jgi:hypothetical protein
MNSALYVTSLFYRLFEFEVYYVPFCLTSTGSARSCVLTLAFFFQTMKYHTTTQQLTKSHNDGILHPNGIYNYVENI